MSRTNWRWARRKERQVEAQIRQEEYDALSTPDKIAQAHARPGQSKRELIRLNCWPGVA